MVPSAAVYPVAIATAALVVWRMRARGCSTARVLAGDLLAIYVGWIVSMTVFPIPTEPADIGQQAASIGFHWNLVPLRTILSQAKYETTWERWRQLGGNMFVFVPFGLLLPLAAPAFRRAARLVVAGLGFSLAVELGQLAVSAVLGYSYRVSDIDDVILNLIGILAGYGLFRLARTLSQRRHRASSSR